MDATKIFKTMNSRKVSSLYPYKIDSLLIPHFALLKAAFSIGYFLVRWGTCASVLSASLWVYVSYVGMHSIFQTRTWRRIAGEGPLNIAPTLFYYLTTLVCVWPMLGFALLVLAVSSIVGFKGGGSAAAKLFFTTLVFMIGAPVRMRGDLPRDSDSRVIVLNHSSFIDNMVIAYLMGSRLWTVLVAPKMMFIPPFCFFLWGRAIVVNKGKKGLDAIESLHARAEEKISDGYTMVVFPEGTRIKDDAKPLGVFRSGAFRIAQATGSRIIPVCIHGARSYAPAGWKRLWVCPQPIYLTIGTSFDSVQYNPQELKAASRGSILEMLKH